MAPKNKNNALLLKNQLCFALYATSRAFTKQYSVLLEDLGVTYPQYLSLLALWEKDGLNIQELASVLELEGATVTPLVQRLEKLGLVDRVRDVEDERRVNIVLTKSGREAKVKAQSIPPAMSCAAEVSEAEAQSMIEQLNKLRNNLK